MKLAREEAEVNEALNKCAESVDSGESKWPGMSYEQGVEAALLWAIGDTDDDPMADA